MKFRSLFESRTESLEVRIRPADFKAIMDIQERKFYFKWLTDKKFVISLKVSFGSNLLFDANHPYTKSDIIFDGRLIEIDESKIKIELKTRSRYFLAILLIILPFVVLGFQMLTKMEFPIFVFGLIFFPLIILGMLILIKAEESRLLSIFKMHLNNWIHKESKIINYG